ncbi:hypothetical protein NDU88_002452 [Pleurodeles waltl]|uniref:Uncharacterized protein n=1 Tax=Pleurodeles waltl TaxID=8319 RepID=A0AAV7QCX8_PLEWA|nr:hypothetical protein NDU88_002452 [Pleurodeles waltl]
MALDGPIEIDEIQTALRQVARNKTSGTDELPVEYYTTFTTQLTTPFLEVLHEAQGRGQLTDSQHEALIVVLPKPSQARPLDVRS